MKLKKTTLLALVLKAGIDPESDPFKKFIGKEAPEDSDDEAPAGLFGEMDKKLLSIDAAKTHPEIEGAVKGKFLALADDAIKEYLTQAGLDDAAQKTLLDGKKTPDRIKLALAKVQDLGKGAGKATDQERETAWQTKETAFKQTIQDLETKYGTEVSGRAQDQAEFALTSFLGNKDNFALRTDVPNIGKYAKGEVLAAIDAKGAKLVVKDGAPLLVFKNDPEKPFFESGSTKALDLKEFTASTLDAAGFIAKQGGEQQQQHNIETPRPTNEAAKGVAQAASSFAANAALLANSAKQTADVE